MASGKFSSSRDCITLSLMISVYLSVAAIISNAGWTLAGFKSVPVRYIHPLSRHCPMHRRFYGKMVQPLLAIWETRLRLILPRKRSVFISAVQPKQAMKPTAS